MKIRRVPVPSELKRNELVILGLHAKRKLSFGTVLNDDIIKKLGIGRLEGEHIIAAAVIDRATILFQPPSGDYRFDYVSKDHGIAVCELPLSNGHVEMNWLDVGVFEVASRQQTVANFEQGGELNSQRFDFSVKKEGNRYSLSFSSYVEDAKGVVCEAIPLDARPTELDAVELCPSDDMIKEEKQASSELNIGSSSFVLKVYFVAPLSEQI